MSRLTAVAVRLPLAWAHCYTAGLAAPLRDLRLAEIRSDTYEHAHDPTLAGQPLRHAWDVLQSFLRGLPDDLRWRVANTPRGIWMVEVVSLSIALAILGASFALAQAVETTSAAERAALGMAGAGLGVLTGLWCAASLRASASRPLFATLPRAAGPPGSDLRGDSVTLQSLARWAGWFLVAAGIFQAIGFAAGAAGGYDYFAGPVTLLNTIADAQALFVVAMVASALTTPLFIPLFVYLALSATERQRARAIAAAGLLGIHVAIAFVGLALFAVLLPIADDFAAATGATAETLETQARGFMQLRFLVIQPAGVAMAIALALGAHQMHAAGMAPRWLTFVGFALALTWLPPIAGEFIVTYPLFLVWTIATGLILLRRPGQPVVLADPALA